MYRLLHRNSFVLLFFLVVLTSSVYADESFQLETVFGPEIPGRYKHPASIEQLDNGDLYLVYYGGEGEYQGDTAVFGARKKKGTKHWADHWTKPKIVADTPFRSEGNAVVWQAPDGIVWLFYVCRYGETWSTSRIKAKISKDGAQSWSDSMLLVSELGMMVRNRPIVLQNGDYLLPIYHETGHDTEIIGADSTSLFLRYNVKKKTWEKTSPIRSVNGNVQPAVVQVEGDYLVSYCRRGGGYGPTKNGWLIRSESRDGGKSWTQGKNSQFRNPNAAVEFLKLRNGHLLLIYNDSMNQRTPLSAAISLDGDKSYPHRCRLLDGPGPYAYPVAIEDTAGKIHLIYTTNNRTVIKHAVFGEKYILEQSAQQR